MVDIYDWNDLDAVRNDLTASYTLQNDLDSSTAGYAGIGDDWTPLGFVSGDRGGTPFSGTLNGQGYQISDLVIEENNGSGGVAFITRVDNGGLVENLELSGTVDSTISGDFFGGLAGVIGDTGAATVQNCISHIDVNAPNGEYVGGLIGQAQVNYPQNCYATGSVTGNNDVGGLVGNKYLSSMENCYSVGDVTGGTNAGALVGFNNNGTITDCYADEQTSGQTSLVGSNGGSVSNSYTLTTAEMQGDEASNSGNMDGFDFANTWDTVLTEDADTSADGYPILQEALDRRNQLEAQDIYFSPDGIYIDGGEYDCLVDGTQYDVVKN